MPDLDLSNRTLGEFVLRERIGVGGHGRPVLAHLRDCQDKITAALLTKMAPPTAVERHLRSVS